MPLHNKCTQLLARVNFPLYAVQAVSERHVLVAGGGGSAKTGIHNVIEIYELVNKGSTCCAEPVAHYETGDEAIMNCTIFNSGKYSVLFAGMEGNCKIFKIRHIIPNNVISAPDSNKSEKSESSVRQRNVGSKDSSFTDHLNSDKTDSNEKLSSSLNFNFQCIDSFQTDFSDEPFQKLVRFSSVAKLLATAGSDGHVRLWKYPVYNKVHDIEAHDDDVDDIDICPFGKKIVSVSRDGHGKVFDVESGELITELEYVLPPKSVGKYIFRSSRFGISEGREKNELVLFTTLNPSVRQRPPTCSYLCKWDTEVFSMQKITSVGTEMLSVMAVSDNGHFVGLGTQEGSVKIYIAFSLQLIHNVRSHGIFVTGLEFLPTNEESCRITGCESSLISISVDNHIILHHIPSRATMGLLTLTTLFILTLFLVFVIMDYFNF